MKKFWYFLKWNFTGMESHSKRFLIYLIIGFVSAFVVEGGFLITALLMFFDMTVEIVRNRYLDYKQEQQDLVNTLKDSSN